MDTLQCRDVQSKSSKNNVNKNTGYESKFSEIIEDGQR